MANEILKIRTKLNLTQKELAEILGLGNAVRIAEYECGKRVPSKSVKIILRLLAMGSLTTEELKAAAIKVKV